MADPASRLVLIVEDDPGVAVLQRRRLERAGFGVKIAPDVDAALAALHEGGVSVVVLDYRLGASTGLDLHRRMQAAGFDLPVIIVSGSVDDTMVVEAMRAGVRDVLLKGSDYLDQLPGSVRAVLAQSEAAHGRASDGTPACVLIVEDDAGTALLERRHLERAGYGVELATSAEEALRIVRSGKITVALIDLRLRGNTSGIDLYETMKAQGWNIPAVLVTAYPDQAVAIRALRSGIRDFVPKVGDYFNHLPDVVERVVGQVRVERKLAESELRLASIIGSTMDAIVMCNAERRIALFNRSAEEMFGCTAADALGTPVDRFIPNLPLAPSSEAEPAALRQRIETHALRAGEPHVPIEVSVTDVLVHGTQLFTVIARDISERRRTEEQLREADRRKDEFLGMLAHELRNPLAAVMNAAEVLHRILPEGPAQKPTAVIRRQARALARMVDDLLDVSRVTLGKIQVAREPLLLGDLVTRSVESARSSIEKAGLALDIAIQPEPMCVRGDVTRIEQVIANLLTNAVKFTPRGGRVSVRAAIEGMHAVIRVQDTGRGIAPELLPRIFDLFVQGETTLDRSTSGLGIGLSLVRQIVQLHGGHVAVFSEGPGKGAEFVVRLPAEPAAVLVPAIETSADHAIPARLSVLVVDDQTDVADSLAVLIQAMGHGVRVVYGGAEALEAMQGHKPDVVFVDIGMPGMTGYEFAAAVRSRAELAGVTLIAVTGYGRDDDRAQSEQAGFNAHLVKPVREGDLLHALAGATARPTGA